MVSGGHSGPDTQSPRLTSADFASLDVGEYGLQGGKVAVDIRNDRWPGQQGASRLISHALPDYLAFARRASSAFSSFLESLPIMVFGRASRNSISAGISILDSFFSRCRRMSSAVATAAGFSLIKALGASPRYASLMPMTVTSSTAACW